MKESAFKNDDKFFKSVELNNESGEMIKAIGSHKYIKRTGMHGNYKYWYKDPKTGKLVEGKGKLAKLKGNIKGRVEKNAAEVNLKEIKDGGGIAKFANPKAVAEKINKHTNTKVVAGDGVVKLKESKKINKEADEISQEDLGAAANLYDKLSGKKVKADPPAIKPNMSVRGSAHVHTFSDDEQEKIYSFLADYAEDLYDKMNENSTDAADIIEDAVADAEDKEKYSSSIPMRVGPVIFSLYAASGVWRIGGGGSMTAPDILKEYLPKIKKALGLK